MKKELRTVLAFIAFVSALAEPKPKAKPAPHPVPAPKAKPNPQFGYPGNYSDFASF